MLNSKNILLKKCNKKIFNSDDFDTDEVLFFYEMLLKYKNSHPFFNHKQVILKLYPNLKWEQIISKFNS